MKTGFICAAGFNVMASATKNGRTLIVVVLGETSAVARAETAAGLLNRGFNGLFGGILGQDLSNFRRQPSPAAPINLYDDICGKSRARGETDDTVSALGPRFHVMEPVKVFTGGADVGPPGTAAAAPAVATPGGEVNIPLPRPRPQYRAGATAPTKVIVQ
jgi:D-alanyl-D-alanine carboxypeptidase